MHGFLNIDKPAGMTSHDVVARVRRLARQKRVGHAGTLDPAATGVLVVALGAATRLVEYVQEDTRKRYVAMVQLGATTTTDDAEGEVLETRPVPALDAPTVEAVLAHFRGEIQQVPPMYSALHHDGKRLYELARAGITVEISSRTVVIHELLLLAVESTLVSLEIECSKGTYIRSLARDLGVALGCGAHLQHLRRTAVGTFGIDKAVPLDMLGDTQAASAGSLDLISTMLLPPDTAVLDWHSVQLNDVEATRVRNGQMLELAYDGERVRVYDSAGTFLALMQREERLWKPVKVFQWS